MRKTIMKKPFNKDFLVETLNKSHFISSNNQKNIAKITGVHQSYVGRILKGQFSHLNTSVMRICEKAQVNPYNLDKNTVLASKNTEIPESIKCAIDQSWNGSQEHAKLIARAIYLIGETRPH